MNSNGVEQRHARVHKRAGVHKLVWEHAQARVFDVTMILFHQLRTTFRHVDQDRQLLTAHCGVARPTHVFTFLDNEISMMILGVHA